MIEISAKEMEINSKLNSKLTWNGILLKTEDKERFIKIKGDYVEATPKDSFIEGVYKGFGTAITGLAYPLVAVSWNATKYYLKVNEEAKKMLGDNITNED